MLVGYASRFLSAIPGGGPVSGQFLAGLHVFWLILSAAILKRPGAATATGILKGLIEAMLTSHLGVFALLVSFLEGFAADLVLLLLRRKNTITPYLASGFSAASNVVVLQLFFLPNLPILVYTGMYLMSFFSGLFLGGFLARRIMKVIDNLLHTKRPKNESKFANRLA